MNLTQLHTFCRVAETQNFTRAAEMLGMTQPAVTQQVRALEDELGQALFDRVGRSVQLTQAGELLFEYARRITGLVDECRSALLDLQGSGRGRLRLASGLTLSMFMLPALLRRYRADHPGVDITISTGSTRQVLHVLLAGEADLAVVTAPEPDDRLTFAHLFDDEMVLLVHPGHPFCQRRAVRPHDLRGEPLIFFEQGSSYRAYLEEFFRREQVTPRIRMDLDSIEAMKRMAEIGLGVTIVPRLSVRAEIERGTLVPIDLLGVAPLTRATMVAYRKGRYLSGPMRAFLDVLEMVYGVRIPREPAAV